MGSMFGSKPQGPSAEELAAQRKQREDLAKREAEATAEAEKERMLTEKRQDAAKRQRSGRTSLIKSGGELGTKSTLG